MPTVYNPDMKARYMKPPKFDKVAKTLGISKANISRYEEVRRAYDNIFSLDGINCIGPIPMDANQKSLIAAEISGNTNNLSNYATGQAMFKALFLQSNNPNSPLLVTSPSLSGVSFLDQAALAAPPADSALLEVYGQQTWGYWRSRRTDFSGVLSVLENAAVANYPGNGKPHKWILEYTGDNTDTSLQLNLNPSINDISWSLFYRKDGTGAYSVFTQTGGATVTIPVATDLLNHYLELILYINSTAFPPFEMAMWQNSGGGGLTTAVRYVNPQVQTVTDYPNWIYNLNVAVTTNFVNITARANQTRMNRTTFVLTNTQADNYAGGNIQVANIYSNEQPVLDYESYLFSLQTNRLDNLRSGQTACWFACTPSDFKFRPATSYPFNPLAAPDTTVNMTVISNIAVGGGTNDSLPLQLKVRGWIDYATQDTTLGSTKVVSHPEEWPKIMGYITQHYRFCDNPTHPEVLAALKKAVAFMMSGDPRAVAFRKVAKGAGKAAMSTLAAAFL
jgi:hypothetical protein